MIFTYDRWDSFCKSLHEKGIQSIAAQELMIARPSKKCLILKHDVENRVKSAFRMAKIEHKWGHVSSYYVQAYLLEKEENVNMLKKMQEMGHEITYHHDVMDANHGDIVAATADFQKKCELFEKHGFSIKTVCQHGNPVVERVGYTSNRDFFRHPDVREKYSSMSDIMVDFKDRAVGAAEYLYFSDAGRKFNLIYDPINNDVCPSDDKNIAFDDLESVMDYVLNKGDVCVISTHPHRWVNSKAMYIVKTGSFKIIRFVAKVLMKVPFAKKIMSKYYYLAKKI